MSDEATLDTHTTVFMSGDVSLHLQPRVKPARQYGISLRDHYNRGRPITEDGHACTHHVPGVSIPPSSSQCRERDMNTTSDRATPRLNKPIAASNASGDMLCMYI